jgi:hypothetical protein
MKEINKWANQQINKTISTMSYSLEGDCQIPLQASHRRERPGFVDPWRANGEI